MGVKCGSADAWTGKINADNDADNNTHFGALAVVHHPPYFGYIHLQQERRVRTAPPVSVRVRVSVSFSVTVLCLQLLRCI